MADKYIKKLADVLCGLIFDKRERDPEAYDTKATVRRIEDGKAYVHIPGGVDETPVDLTIDAKAGDTVQVRVSGGRAWLVGNRTAPPTDDTTARTAQGTAAKAEVRAEQAEETANGVNGIANSALVQAAAAKQIADDTEQHFWFQETGADTGAHITEVTQEEWSDPSDPNYHSGGNFLGRSNGIALREGMTELATFQQSGMDINSYDGGGNSVNIAHLGYGSGTASGGGTAIAPYYSIGVRLAGEPVGNYSIAEGYANKASKWCSHAEGEHTTASNDTSHAEGRMTTASGDASHAEGLRTTASGNYSHAEGQDTNATAQKAHAEGFNTTASGDMSHAEGVSSTANGNYSHAEGFGTTASGYYSHANGNGNTACTRSQTVVGEYNELDTSGSVSARGDYAFIIGNGTSDNARSNALEVTWAGDVKAYGDIEDGSGNVLSNKANTSTVPTNSDIVDLIYPVGAIYMSVNSTSPQTLFGGTWERITGRFLLAATDGGSSGASQAAGNTGGAATVTLTAAQSGLPSHSHGAGSGQAFIRYNQTATSAGVQERSVASGASGNYKAPVVNHASVDFSYLANTSAEGGTAASSAHNNMPPYLSVYMWKRTA